MKESNLSELQKEKKEKKVPTTGEQMPSAVFRRKG